MSDDLGFDGTGPAGTACLSAVKDVLATALKRRRDVLAHNVVEFGTAFVTCLESASADPAAAGLAASDPGLPTELADLASQAGRPISHQA